MDSSDERNLLVWEFARLVGELQPRVFVMGMLAVFILLCFASLRFCIV